MSEDIYISLPCSNDAETAALSCMLKDSSRLDDALDLVSEEWFYQPAHQKIYAAMQRVASAGKAIDLITLIEQLNNDGQLDEVGGRSDVAALLDSIPTVGFWDHYLSILKEKYQLRQIIKSATDIVQAAYDNPENAQALADESVETMSRVADCVSKREEMPTMKERALDAIERYEQATHNKGLQGLATGLTRLDEMTGGFQKSELSIIAARPSFGKTAIMTQVAGHISIENGHAAGIFSGEMDGDGLTDRFFSQMAGINLRDLNGGKLTKHDFTRLLNQAKQFVDASLTIDDRAGLTISEIRRAGRRMKHKQGVKIILLDYLQRFRADTQKENSDERARYAAISSGLKDMAKELKIPVVCLAQLGRGADVKKAWEMRMSDLEGCSKIEQDADFIGFLGRPKEEEMDVNPIFNDTDLNVAKQRNGPTGIIQLRFRKAHTTFSEKAVIE